VQKTSQRPPKDLPKTSTRQSNIKIETGWPSIDVGWIERPWLIGAWAGTQQVLGRPGMPVCGAASFDSEGGRVDRSTYEVPSDVSGVSSHEALQLLRQAGRWGTTCGCERRGTTIVTMEIGHNGRVTDRGYVPTWLIRCIGRAG
jgi:hypothetical protein